MIEIGEKNTLEDALVGLFYQAQHSKLYKQKLWKTMILAVLLFLLFIYLFFLNKPVSLWPMILTGLFSIAILIFYPLRFKEVNIEHCRRFLENKVAQLGPNATKRNVLYLNDDGIRVLGNGHDLEVLFEEMEKLVEVKTHLILLISKRGTLSFNKNSTSYMKIKQYFKNAEILYVEDLKWKL